MRWLPRPQARASEARGEWQTEAPPPRAWWLLAFCALAFIPTAAAAAPTDEIKPPFGLQWGESSDHLETLLKGVKATIVEKRDMGDRVAWTVEGLTQAFLRRTIFYFKTGMLIEVELQYQNPQWDNMKYDEFMGQVRQRIEQKYGAGQLIARSKTPEDGNIMQTVVGYKWNQNNTAIQLFYFSAENATQIFRTVSVHYKTY